MVARRLAFSLLAVSLVVWQSGCCLPLVFSSKNGAKPDAATPAPAPPPAAPPTADESTSSEPGARPQQPSERSESYTSRDGAITLDLPTNWEAIKDDGSDLIFAPTGGYEENNGGINVTHGIFVGLQSVANVNLRSATDVLVQQVISSNSGFRVEREKDRIDFLGQEGYYTILTGPSAISGVGEINQMYTTSAADGRVLYLNAIAPEDEVMVYQATFINIVNSLRLAR
jgi:hypothetical protein